uniref:Replication protein A subunit n=1 Tax=Chenopodium quinoa TaxID=63459 RepID=A0A803LS82_CHEQI
MVQGYVYLDELNSSSKNYSVKVKVVEKSRPKTSSKKGVLFQNLLLSDEKGNKMKAALFGEQVDSFNEAIVYNGQYLISNAPIKLIEERWRNNSNELPFQMSFGGQTVVQRVNSEQILDGPMFQSIQSIPRMLMPGAKYDVLGIVLYVEDKVRIININQDRECHVREIVITDQTMDQPLVITTWNDLADDACDAISLYAKTFDVIGFTALKPSVHKGFSLSTGISTEVIYDPKGDKAEILSKWAKFHTQKLLEQQAKACNVLQEERHWLQVTISQPDLKDVVAYIGCSACGKRIDIPVGKEFSCNNCKKKDSISAYRVTYKFIATDQSGKMVFTTFTADTEKLFGISAEEIHLMKNSHISNSQFLVQVGPTAALSRNNILQWCLKGIKVESQNHVADKLHSDQNPFKQSNEEYTTGCGMFEETEYQTTDEIATVHSLLELLEQPPKKICTELHLSKANESVIAQTASSVHGSSLSHLSNQVGLSTAKPICVPSEQVAASSHSIETFTFATKEEPRINKSAEVISTTAPKKRSLTALLAQTEVFNAA